MDAFCTKGILAAGGLIKYERIIYRSNLNNIYQNAEMVSFKFIFQKF